MTGKKLPSVYRGTSPTEPVWERESSMNVLASRIRELRSERKLGREKLARLVDVSMKSIQTWEADAGDPSLANLMSLARVFGVTPDYLLGETDERRPSVTVAESPAPRGPARPAEDSAEAAAALAARRGSKPRRKQASRQRPPEA